MAEFDVLVRGGHVVDPANDRSASLDVAVSGGRIAAVEASIDPGRAAEVIDASGQYVTPGLIDLHTHVYWGVTYWGIEPDPVAARSGVTTWLDVGSAGGYTWPGFRRFVAEPAKSRIFALLNMSSIGLVAPTWELSNLDYCDVDLGQMMVEANRDLIVGIKARIDASTTRGTGIEPLKRARELADKVGLPLMIHIGTAPPTLEEILEQARPGDILTHCFTGQVNKIVDDQGVVFPSVKELHDRGLILDIGHGAGSFAFATAEAMLQQGILPDVISTDIHQLAIQGPAFDMPITLSKFLNLGMSIEQVIACATVNAARAIRNTELGTLGVGAPADIATFTLEDGDFTFQDVFMNERKGSQLLVNTMTMVGGEVLPIVEEPPLQPWAKLPAHQQGKVIPVRPV
ncbi:MAG: amidohydrolase/deacetylase family metallohydrolase [Chloroflexota bacterium]|nr:amidohydrolase/deacetylase family metallohydrolase [Chloroflexota bacterium]